MPAFLEPIDESSKFHISIKKPEDNDRIRTLRETNAIMGGRLPRTAEWVTHPKLDGATPWNISTEFTEKFKQETYDDLMNSSMKHTKLMNKKVPEKISNYESPMERSQKISEQVRKLKAENNFSYNRPVFQSKEKPVDKRSLVNRFAIEPSRKYKITEHSGVWEFNKSEGR